MTELATPLVVAVLALPTVAAAVVALMPSLRAADRLNLALACITAALALALAIDALAAAPDVAARQSWYVLDTGGGIFLALIAVVGLASAAVTRNSMSN